MIEKIYKIWYVIDTPDLVIPTFGLPSSTILNIEEKRLKCRFPQHPTIEIVRRNKRFIVTPEYNDFALLECKLSQSSGKFETGKYEIKIKSQDPNQTPAIAYYYLDKDKTKTEGIQIRNQIDAGKNNQIVIKENGEIEISDNLIGKTIKCRCPVIYLGATQETSESFSTISAHIVGKWKDGGVKYLELKSGKLDNDESKYLILKEWIKMREEYLA